MIFVDIEVDDEYFIPWMVLLFSAMIVFIGCFWVWLDTVCLEIEKTKISNRNRISNSPETTRKVI